MAKHSEGTIAGKRARTRSEGDDTDGLSSGPRSLLSLERPRARERLGDAPQAQANERSARNLGPRSRSLPPTADTPTAIGAPMLLPHAASQAQSLQLLHRLGRLIGKRAERVCGKSKLGDRHATAFEREPAEPSHRGALVAIGITVSQHQANAQRIVKRDLWKLTGRGEDEVGVAGLERAPEASVWTAGVTHGEHMFAPSSRRTSLHAVGGQSRVLASAVGRMVRTMVALDRVQERRRAVALARHYRDEEGLSIAQIAGQLGRAEATVKAYLYDPSDANKKPTHRLADMLRPLTGCPLDALGVMVQRVLPEDRIVLRWRRLPQPH